MADLIKTDGQLERAQYALLGLPLGYLFNRFDENISNPKGQQVVCSWKPGRQIYDTEKGDFVPYTETLIDNIPKTFTFAQRPENAEQEVEYYVRSVSLPKHSFYWSNSMNEAGIPFGEYAAIKGFTNKAYRGRYTLTPNLPGIKKLGHYNEFGFYVMDEEDWDLLFNH